MGRNPLLTATRNEGLGIVFRLNIALRKSLCHSACQTWVPTDEKDLNHE